MPTSDPCGLGRRRVLAGLVAAAALGALGGAAAGQGGSQAASLVASLAEELQRLVNSGRGAGQVTAGMEGILARYADMPAVAASVLGPPWRNASAGQRQAFVAAFQSYLARKYGAQFREYQNASIEIRGTRDGGRAGVLVQTIVKRPGQEDIAVDWQVSDRSGRARVVNLVIEGVSMLANERAEIGAMLEAARGDVNGLIAQLQARA
jgi:phospholipid transport system substrate-binding protein